MDRRRPTPSLPIGWQPIWCGHGPARGNHDRDARRHDRRTSERQRGAEERLDAALQRNSDFDERIDHQAATIDVLKAMSASPGDPQPVFDLIATGRANCAGPSRRCCSNMMVSWCICERGVGGTRLPPKAICGFPMRPDRSTGSAARSWSTDRPYSRRGRGPGNHVTVE